METKRQHFSLGRLLSTPGAQDTLAPDDVLRCLGQHAQGDWGDCGAEDWAANDSALNRFERLFSVYHDCHGTRFWIITEADRSSTMVLLPDEY